jgi:hypothetical protein
MDSEKFQRRVSRVETTSTIAGWVLSAMGPTLTGGAMWIYAAIEHWTPGQTFLAVVIAFGVGAIAFSVGRRGWNWWDRRRENQKKPSGVRILADRLGALYDEGVGHRNVVQSKAPSAFDNNAEYPKYADWDQHVMAVLESDLVLPKERTSFTTLRDFKGKYRAVEGKGSDQIQLEMDKRETRPPRCDNRESWLVIRTASPVVPLPTKAS